MQNTTYIPIMVQDPFPDVTNRRVTVSPTPTAGGVQVTSADGLRTLNLLASFWDPSVDFGEASYSLLEPVADGSLYVPPGWMARIYLITLACGLFGGDITTATVKPVLGITDHSASFGAITCTAAVNAIAAGEPVSPPFEIDGDGAETFHTYITTNGTSTAVLNVIVHIYGYLYRRP